MSARVNNSFLVQIRTEGYCLEPEIIKKILTKRIWNVRCIDVREYIPPPPIMVKK